MHELTQKLIDKAWNADQLRTRREHVAEKTLQERYSIPDKPGQIGIEQWVYG